MEFNYYTIIIGFLISIVLFFRLPKLKSRKLSKQHKVICISVIIPARNEEHNLPNILADLEKQTYDLLEVICVDDDSHDSTAKVIREAGVRYLKPKNLPSGWKGKPWACQKGAEVAKGDVLLFIDADVRLASTAIESLVAHYVSSYNPISVQPYHFVTKKHEYFSLFFMLVQICATGMSFFAKKKSSGFYGPLLMISKKMFDENGGYEAVKNDVVEDFRLGRYYNKKGINIELLMGARQVSFRMYPESFSDLLEGWSKNFSSGSISLLPWVLLLIIAWIAFLTALPIEIVQTSLEGNIIFLVIIGVMYLIAASMIYRTARAMGSYPIYVCILYPIYLLVFQIIFLYSILATFVFKRTTWKGRKL